MEAFGCSSLAELIIFGVGAWGKGPVVFDSV